MSSSGQDQGKHYKLHVTNALSNSYTKILIRDEVQLNIMRQLFRT
jgi:hypothetical protein